MINERQSDFRPNAWLLDFGHALHAAVGTRVLLHVIDNPKLHTVPCSPSYCHSVFSWQGQLLPVMDMASLLTGDTQTPLLLAIAGYQDQTENVTRFGAFLLSAPPTAIAVSDTQSCPLPEHPVSWSKFSLSCFNYYNEAIPILNLARIFARPINSTRIQVINSIQNGFFAQSTPT